MKNVIAILIDSLYAECLSKGRTKVSSSPFIDRLLEKSIFADNVYSYAPYTDAATKGLFCSMPTLSEFGYYFGINGSDVNPYKIFKENGYETYGFYYPYYLTSPKIEQYIDHSIYTTGYIYYGTWRGQFDYYADIKKKRALTSDELLVVEKCVELMFVSWIKFYDNVLEKKESSIIIDNILVGPKENVVIARTKLLEEFGKFKNNPEQYIYGMFELGMNHPIAKIDPYDINRFANHSFLRTVYKNNGRVLKKAQSKNFWCNLKNNRFSFSKTFQGVKDYIRTKDLYELKYPINYLLGLETVKSAQKRSFKTDWKYKASARKQVEVGMACLAKHDKSKPFYAFFHFLDVHQNINYFSFDINNIKKVNREFDYMKPMINGIDSSFVGSLGYQMAICYTDYCIKLLFEKLEAQGLLNDTVVLLYADHGSSYTYYPVRKRTVNCFHKENHNVPVILWDNDINNPICKKQMYTSADIYTTLYDYLNLKVNEKLYGRSMLDNNGREYVITEYMGPGCPDMFTRDIWLSIRNDRYMIAYKSNISKRFDRNHPHQIFDLKKDPLERNNLARTINLTDRNISLLIDKLENRFNEINTDKNLFLNKLKKGEIAFSE